MNDFKSIPQNRIAADKKKRTHHRKRTRQICWCGLFVWQFINLLSKSPEANVQRLNGITEQQSGQTFYIKYGK